MNRFIVLSLLVASGAMAAPVITSTPQSNQVLVNQQWFYAPNGGPAQATGAGTLVWSLSSTFLQPDGGPFPPNSGVVMPEISVSNLSGVIYFLSPTPGVANVVLSVTDDTLSVGTQSFAVRVDAPPRLVIAPPGTLATTVRQTISGQFRLADGGSADSWSVSPAVEGLIVQNSNGAWFYTPTQAGSGTALLTASSSGQQSGSVPFNWAAGTQPIAGPTAGFTVSTTTPAPRDEVKFTQNQVKANIAEPEVQTRFDFGDGTSSRVGGVEDFSHVWVLPGGYRIRQTVQNAQSQTASFTAQIAVKSSDLTPPLAAIKAVSAIRGLPGFTFEATCECTKGSGELQTLEWNFGDGITTTQTSTGSSVKHGYSSPGGYNVRLTVRDSNGLEATDTFYVAIAEGDKQPPFATARASVVAGDIPLTTRLTAEFGDPTSQVTRRVWRLWDGRVLVDNEEAVELSITQPGEYPAELTVTNALGLSSTDRLVLKATRGGQLPPVIVSRCQNPFAVVDQPWKYDDDSKPNARSTPPFKFDLGRPSGTTSIGDPPGADIDKKTGVITWTPRAELAGTEQTVSITVENNAGFVFEDCKVQVVSAPPTSECTSGCCCTSIDGSGAYLMLGLGALVLLRRRRV